MELEDADPDFFKYLKENDADLLDFGDDDSEGEDDAGDGYEGSDIDYDEDGGDDIEERERIEVTSEYLNECVGKAVNGKLMELKNILSMFRSACIPSGDRDDADEEGMSTSVSRFVIHSPELYESVMTQAIENIHKAFKSQLGVKSLNRTAVAELGSNPKWKKIQLLVLSFFKSIVHTLNGVAANMRQSQVGIYLLSSMEPYIPFLAPLPRLAKGVTKVLLNIWSHVPGSELDVASDDTVAIRGHAFLRMRQMAMILPGAIAEECFRAIYLKFARQNRSCNEFSAPSVVFMIQSVAELYQTDAAVAYQQAFVYIRQLALHLRAAILKKSGEAMQQLTSWQYVHCLRLWTRVICSMPSQETGLGALAYPLIQIICGNISTATSIYYAPLKIHLVCCLQQLAASCQVFVPTMNYIFEMLECEDLVSKPTPSTDLAPKLQYLTKLANNSITHAVVREALVQDLAHLLRQEVEVYRFHVGFPEYAYIPLRRLHQFSKKCKMSKWRELLRVVMGQMEQYMAYAKNHRIALGVAPMSIVEFEPLLPPGEQPCRARLSCILLHSGAAGTGAVADNVKKVDSESRKQLKAAFKLARTPKEQDESEGDESEAGRSEAGEGEDDVGLSDDEVEGEAPQRKNRDGKKQKKGKKGAKDAEQEEGLADMYPMQQQQKKKGKRAQEQEAKKQKNKSKAAKHKRAAQQHDRSAGNEQDQVGALDWDDDM